MNLQLIVNKGVVANVENKTVEQYRQNAVQVAGLNMSMDSGYGNIAKKKDIAKELTLGYMKLLSK